MATLYLKNIEQVALFELELKGQLSDGHWENASPRDHWQPWCACGAVVWEGRFGRDFWAPRDRYATASRALLEVVGGRMLGQVRLARAFGLEVARKLEPFLACEEDYAVPPIAPLTFGPGEPDLADVSYGKRELAQDLKEIGLAQEDYTLERINAALADQTYGKRELVRDLKEIGLAMRTRVV